MTEDGTLDASEVEAGAGLGTATAWVLEGSGSVTSMASDMWTLSAEAG